MDELTGDLLTAAQSTVKVWRQYRRGIYTVAEVLHLLESRMVALASAAEELEEEE